MENKLVDGRGRGKAEAIAATSEREGGMSGGGGKSGGGKGGPQVPSRGHTGGWGDGRGVCAGDLSVECVCARSVVSVVSVSLRRYGV